MQPSAVLDIGELLGVLDNVDVIVPKVSWLWDALADAAKRVQVVIFKITRDPSLQIRSIRCPEELLDWEALFVLAVVASWPNG